MRAVLQRVTSARVDAGGETVGAVGTGLLVLLGIEEDDTQDDAKYIAAKTVGMRIFNDDAGKFNRSVQEVGGAILLVSQFTLHGDSRKGRRPSFVRAARPEKAIPLYEYTAEALRGHGLPVETGVFGAHMEVHLVNDGPVTILLDSRKVF
jgi:D-tyrosyl-tRNA(Tyr) deacylase